jgi:hypothetical protein
VNRYSDALAAVAHHLGAVRRGWCLVQCVAGEQGEVAACLAQLLGLPMAAISDDLEPFSGCVVQLLPQQAAATRDAALSSINGRRDRLSDRGRWILVASRSELAPLQRRAADIFSVLQAVEVVPLQPRQLTAEQAVAARSQLAAVAPPRPPAAPRRCRRRGPSSQPGIGSASASSICAGFFAPRPRMRRFRSRTSFNRSKRRRKTTHGGSGLVGSRQLIPSCSAKRHCAICCSSAPKGHP